MSDLACEQRGAFPDWCYSRVTAAVLGSGGVSALLLVWPLPAEITAHMIIHIVSKIVAAL